MFQMLKPARQQFRKDFLEYGTWNISAPTGEMSLVLVALSIRLLTLSNLSLIHI